MCVTDVLALTLLWPHSEGAGMKQPKSGKPLPKEFPERSLQTQVCSAAQREASANHSTGAHSNLPAVSLSEDTPPPASGSWLSLGSGGAQQFCFSDALPWLRHFCILLLFQWIPKKTLSCIWQFCMGQVFIVRKLFSKASQTLTFDMGMQVWTRKA